jgi:hypothetical protein
MASYLGLASGRRLHAVGVKELLQHGGNGSSGARVSSTSAGVPVERALDAGAGPAGVLVGGASLGQWLAASVVVS